MNNYQPCSQVTINCLILLLLRIPSSSSSLFVFRGVRQLPGHSILQVAGRLQPLTLPIAALCFQIFVLN